MRPRRSNHSVIERILDSAGTPFFSFRDIYENKPAASFKVLVETIHYFLARHLEDVRVRRAEVGRSLAAHERRLRDAAAWNPAADRGSGAPAGLG